MPQKRHLSTDLGYMFEELVRDGGGAALWEGQVKRGGDGATGPDCTCQHIWGKVPRAKPYTDISKRA